LSRQKGRHYYPRNVCDGGSGRDQMWSQCEQNHISSPISLTARVRTARLELHIGQFSGGGIRSNANFVNRQTGHNSSSSKLFPGGVGTVAVTEFSVAPHDEQHRNGDVGFIDAVFFELIGSKVNAFKCASWRHTECEPSCICLFTGDAAQSELTLRPARSQCCFIAAAK